MAFICSALPSHIWEHLTDNLVSCFDGEDILKNCTLDSGENIVEPEPFECAHFSWYNRYATKVSENSLL
jgi:hypothetical protein